jgi:Na+/H+ antiporter NhaD/arsenite permease-like protein
MSAIFLLGYVGIIFENYFEFNKAAIAMLMSAALWTVFADEAGSTGIATAVGALTEKLAEVSEVVYFILGAMTIVEIVDAHQGFKVVTDKVNSKNKRGLMTIISLITFFMSAILDNLTTTIVMVSVIKKILPNIDDRKLFGALIVIAANAGGAWTPIGDVTTTMLWINGQITALPTMTSLFLPSLVSTIIPTLMLQQQIPEDEPVPESSSDAVPLAPRGSLVFATGVLGLLSVPVFKSLTGLPPYLGMLSALGVMWTLTDAIHAGEREELMAPAALRKIDTSGVLFFLGILMSVGALDAAGILKALAELLDKSISSDSLLASMIGIASSVIDNVPLVVSICNSLTT